MGKVVTRVGNMEWKSISIFSTFSSSNAKILYFFFFIDWGFSYFLRGKLISINPYFFSEKVLSKVFIFCYF